jgi:hypothetical protein
MIETCGLYPHEHLACAQRSYFLNADLNYLGAASAERARDSPVSNRAHFDNHITQPM